ncbi:TPR-like protein [Gymnopus androsaceus JB14]|uniref:TPR-like protein n=1 Tax=Gymnopus androsaceus JB14 TaxID=1447944 RepID=A0A6A4I8L8_9AGAR|nr:TPR-like protein [Gymnopus androsaceus JB14]
MLASQDSGSIRILPLPAYLPNGVPFWTLNLPQLSPDIGDDLEMTILIMNDSGLIYEESTSLRMLSPIREYVQTKHPVTQHHLAQISSFYIAPQQAHLEAIYCFTKFIKFYPQTLPMLDKALTQEWSSKEHINIRFLRAGIMQWMGYHKQAILEIQKIETTEMGVIYYMQGECSQAIEKFTNAKTQFENIGNQLGAARCLQSLGDIHHIQGEYPQAIEKLTDARTQFENIGNQQGVAYCLHKLGEIHHIGNQVRAAQCLQSLGDPHCMQGEYPQAMEKLTKAKIQFDKIGNQLGAAQCLRSLGDIHYMQGEYPQAMEKLTDARTQFEKIGNQLWAACCLKRLGDTHYMQGEYPEAIEKLTSAKNLFEKIGDQNRAAKCLKKLDYIQLKLSMKIYMQGEYPEAIEKLTSAKNLFEKIGDQNRLQSA